MNGKAFNQSLCAVDQIKEIHKNTQVYLIGTQFNQLLYEFKDIK